MMTRAAILIAATLLAGVAHAEDLQPSGTAGNWPSGPSAGDLRPVATFSIAVETCALFMRDRAAYPMLHINWAMGFLEALNFSALSKGEDTRQIFLPATELDSLLVNYCRLHPDDHMSFAVVSLYRQMPIIPGSQSAFQRRPRN